jgi:hypothetical protein
MTTRILSIFTLAYGIIVLIKMFMWEGWFYGF